MFTLSAATLSIVIGVLLPILVGLVTKELASGALKATILAFLSAVAGLVNGAVMSGGVFTQEALLAAATTWVIAVATYYGWYKPSGVTQAVQEKTSDIGIGPDTRAD